MLAEAKIAYFVELSFALDRRCFDSLIVILTRVTVRCRYVNRLMVLGSQLVVLVDFSLASGHFSSFKIKTGTDYCANREAYSARDAQLDYCALNICGTTWC